MLLIPMTTLLLANDGLEVKNAVVVLAVMAIAVIVNIIVAIDKTSLNCELGAGAATKSLIL